MTLVAQSILIIPYLPKRKRKREYYKLKKNSNMIKSTNIEERVNGEAQQENIQGERKLHALITTEKSK